MARTLSILRGTFRFYGPILVQRNEPSARIPHSGTSRRVELPSPRGLQPSVSGEDDLPDSLRGEDYPLFRLRTRWKKGTAPVDEKILFRKYQAERRGRRRGFAHPLQCEKRILRDAEKTFAAESAFAFFHLPSISQAMQGHPYCLDTVHPSEKKFSILPWSQ